MAVDDFLAYSALYERGKMRPLVPFGQVTPNHLGQGQEARNHFLRSVDVGPLDGESVAALWGDSALRMLYDWSRNPFAMWSESLARKAYDWFSEKTAEATKKFWWNGLLLAKAWADSSRSARADLPRLTLPTDVRRMALHRYQRSHGGRPRYTYYHRTVTDGDFISLQYWFFYAYNDWANGFGGFNDHEGDWEGIQLFFRREGSVPVEPPSHISYLGHHSRITKAWDHPDIQKDGPDATHPHVYVAAGSHASYPQPKSYPLMALYNLIDYATGGDLILPYAAWDRAIDLADQPWITEFTGSWGTRYWVPLSWLSRSLGMLITALPGEVQLPGVSAPRGPKLDDEGEERQIWREPVAFAGVEEKG
jgi:hypothetical protein